MTDGTSARVPNNSAEQEARKQFAINAGRVLGLEWVDEGKFPDNAMDTVGLLEIVKEIERIKRLTSPTIVYTHSAADLNVDHRIVNQATLTAFRPQPEETWQEIRTFEVASSTDFGHKPVSREFCPNLWVNIADTWKIKLAALQEYADEMRDAPHSRSIEGLENLAKYRGSQVGLHYAEAFQVPRRVIR